MPRQIKDLRNILTHLNRESNQNSSWATLIADEVTSSVARKKDAVGEFLVI